MVTKQNSTIDGALVRLMHKDAFMSIKEQKFLDVEEQQINKLLSRKDVTAGLNENLGN